MTSEPSTAALGRAFVVAIGALLAGWPVAAMAQPRTVAQIANYAGADRQKVLEEGARKEGVLLIYTTGTQIQPLIERFKQKYPYLRTELARAPSIDVAAKVMEEYSAGVYSYCVMNELAAGTFGFERRSRDIATAF
jgi:iron(III) transport system substrate-binding protein